MILEFSVVGTPVPQGSTRAFALKKGKAAGKIITTNDPTGSIGKWRGDIRAVLEHPSVPGLPIADAVKVGLVFRFTRPASDFLPANSRREFRLLRPDAAEHLTGRADIDKLARAVLDALTGVVWVDDGQVVALYAAKRYDERAGVDVRVVSAS